MRWYLAAGLGILVGAVLVALGFMLFHVACLAYERPVTHFANLTEARDAGAIERGWIPSFMPASSEEIREVHDIDTNAQWMRFRVADLGELDGVCEERLSARPALPRDPGRAHSRWWPGRLGEYDPETWHTAWCPGWLVVDPETNDAYHWNSR